ncbi:autophagy-related protein 23-like isoform X2 [Harmonia axyridis]|uniref:autophagy-related protein 23-like isoform X2 n=1 Tax=Harmonia axyridis TaxID=115357 RepID=UPI001E276608|nr:autophagy-related protein 23-like isoform X2 [Harmonia axyridis]
MLRQEVDEEDLRTEIYSLRKHIARVCSENQILKVKIRKLQDEMMKRDKQLDDFLNSKRVKSPIIPTPLYETSNLQFFGLSKNVQDKGASVLMNLKLKNDKLEQSLMEKDMMIKRLQNTLQTAKLYNSNSVNKKLASKGVECIILGDNKLEYEEKSRINTKLELRMPSFDMGDFEENEESYRKDISIINKKNAKSVESQFSLDINMDLKHTTKPFYHSGTRYERTASYHVEAKGSKSEGLLERLSGEFIPISNGSNGKKKGKKEVHYEKQRDEEQDACMHPSFKKILQTIEDLMTRGTNAELNFSRTLTVDESVQFPMEDSKMLGMIDSPSDDLTQEDLILTDIKSDNENYDMGKILEDEQPPSILDEVQVNDQSDPDLASISEKFDGMEKTETQQHKKKIILEEMPHEEIKQLHVYLLDMISQVDCLKDTIFHMKEDQQKTESDLKIKDENIEKLAKEIEELKELKLFSIPDAEKMTTQLRSNVDIAEKDCASIESFKDLQKATQQNIKKIVGKMKTLNETKSKSSISSQTEKKSSKTSSKSSKPEKKKASEKSHKKLDRKVQEPSESKKIIGIGNGDVVDLPFYRCGIVTECAAKTSKNEYDELD